MQKSIFRKGLVLGIIVLFIGASVIPLTGSTSVSKTVEKPNILTLDGNTLYVGGSGPGNYTSIQSAINAAVSGDTVYVYSGTYYEHIIVNKAIDLIGEDRDTTIIDGGGGGVLITINSDDCILNSFTLQNAILGSGIVITSDFNEISNNNIETSTDQGYNIAIYGDNNIITENDISDSWMNINCHDGGENVLSNNTISVGDYGIWLWDSDNNSILNNKIDFVWHGISFGNNAENNNIVNNSVSVCYYGISTMFPNANNNIIYHNNIFNNTVNGKDIGTNTWDNDYPSGGNYWDDYTGEDNNGDGVGDIPYSISGGYNEDRYPLMTQYGCSPHADFTFSVDNLTCSFNASWSYDYDGNITSHEWYFGDSTNDAGMHVNHTYSTYGTYNVTLIVTDDDGNNDTILKSIQITDTIPPEISDVILTTSEPLDINIGWENFSCTVIDNIGVDEVKLVLIGDTTTEYPMIKNGDDYYCNITISPGDEYTYHIWANDTNRNYNISASQPFDLPPNWDVDMNGQAYFEDLIAIVMRYGETGPPGWVREDVDNNGEVYFDGLIAVVMHYGEWWK